ncbi:AMP-binding protein [Streptomyces sp. NPDC005728]|uniref:AMP-binding protein n=1 Tax=Streptomyces sp. NPDC005728 TaxID=3157054 RepID=UPI0033E78CBA
MSGLTDLLAATAARTPCATAVAESGHELTYASLWADSGRLAHCLRGEQLTGQTVVLAVLPGIRWITALLGVWRAGAVALPVDLAQPYEHLARITSGCRARAALTHTGKPLRWAPSLRTMPVSVNSDRGAEPLLPGSPSDDTPAYIWHGGIPARPCPLVVTHRALAARANAVPHLAGISRADRVAQLAPVTAEAVLWEVLCALVTGARLEIAGPFNRTPGPPRAGFLERHVITAFTCTFDELVATPYVSLSKLRRIVLRGGDPDLPALARWLGRYDVAAAYGVPETCGDALFAGNLRESDDPAPIGWPLPGVLAWVLDERQRPVPRGEPGELYLGGDALAIGYPRRTLRRTEATGAFVRLHLPPPNDPQGSTADVRLYRTRDRVLIQDNGQYVVLGHLSRISAAPGGVFVRRPADQPR